MFAGRTTRSEDGRYSLISGAAEGVVSERDRVHPMPRIWSASRGVMPIPSPRSRRSRRTRRRRDRSASSPAAPAAPAYRGADDVGDEQDAAKRRRAYGTPSVADGKTWRATLLPAVGGVLRELPAARNG
jgi:hypothetical protein